MKNFRERGDRKEVGGKKREREKRSKKLEFTCLYKYLWHFSKSKLLLLCIGEQELFHSWCSGHLKPYCLGLKVIFLNDHFPSLPWLLLDSSKPAVFWSDLSITESGKAIFQGEEKQLMYLVWFRLCALGGPLNMRFCICMYTEMDSHYWACWKQLTAKRKWLWRVMFSFALNMSQIL